MSPFLFCVHELAVRYHLRNIEAPSLMTPQQTGEIPVVSTVCKYGPLELHWSSPEAGCVPGVRF